MIGKAGSWVFVLGGIIAVLVGVLHERNFVTSTLIVVVLGLIAGFSNLNKEHGFLVITIVFMVVSFIVIDLANVLTFWLINSFNALAFFSAAASVPVALKLLFADEEE